MKKAFKLHAYDEDNVRRVAKTVYAENIDEAIKVADNFANDDLSDDPFAWTFTKHPSTRFTYCVGYQGNTYYWEFIHKTF